MKSIFVLLFLTLFTVTIALPDEEPLQYDNLEATDDAAAIQKYNCCNILRHVQECKNQLICQLCSFLNEIATAMSNAVQNYLPNYLYYCINSFFYEISNQVCNLVPYWYCYNGPWYYAAASKPEKENPYGGGVKK